jgi:CDP-6-deoxy-D-xylo-4-hexulose-3-dehydrase
MASLMNKKDIEMQIKILFDRWVDETKAEIAQQEKVRYAGPVLGREEYRKMLDAIFSNWWSGGSFTFDAEKELALISDRNHGLLTNSGSSANLILMEAAKELYFKDGDKILTLSCGFPTTVNPIISAGLIPVFVDIDMDTLNLSPEVLDKALSKDKDIKGVFVAHTLGFKSDIKALLDVVRKHKVHLFFDCCDAYGTKYEGAPIQSYGKGASFSFYVAHHLTMGEGGGIVTNDPDLHATMRGFRNWGRYCASPNCCIRSKDPSLFCPTTKLTKDCDLPSDYIVNYQYEWLGYNLKPLEIQSAILQAQIPKLEEFNEIRRKNYDQFLNYFNSMDLGIKTWEIDEETSPFAFPLLLENTKFNRKHLADHLQRDKIETRVLFGGNLMLHPAYNKKAHLWESFGKHDNANNIAENFIMLGVSPVNDTAKIEKVIESLDSFFKKW